MQKKLLFLASSLAFGLGISNAQSQNVPFRNYCATDSMTNAAMAQYPDYARGRKTFTDMIKSLNNSPEAARIVKNGGKYTIPIVIHIMHTYGSNNITDAQVMDAVRIINEDYSKSSLDTGTVASVYKPLHANVEFEFKLAQKDPQGNCTTGITRTYTTLTGNADNNVKNLIRWAPEKYLNIWVVDRISFGAGGYSYLPCNVPPNLEGVVILNSQFGSIGLSNGGNFSARSLTHEIGHYMGLPHVWGAGNTPGAASNCGMDDGIADTPNTVGSTNFSCNTNSNTCTGTNYPFPDPNGAMPDNVQNFMDYSSCAKMFTNGQKAVMVSSLFNTAANTNCRNTLSDSLNLIATGTNPGFVPGACAPDVDFSATSSRVCAGNIVSFQEQSYNLRGSAATFHWTFPGGTPATSTSPNPFVTYNTPGTYNVTLRVTNANGQDSLTKTNAVIVGTGNSVAGLPFIRGFEKANFPTDANNPGESWEREVSGSNGWERTTSVAATGVGSLRVRNNIVTAGLTNSLISPIISFYNVQGASLKFKLAHAQKTADSNERMVISISEDCGNTWVDRYIKSGATLATAPVTSSGNFSPAASHWRQETVVIPNTFAGGNLMFKFEVTSDGGNPVYLDDIEINGTISGLNESLASAANLNVYPNPSNGEATVSFALPTATDYTLEVLSVTGQQIGKSLVKQSQNGTQEIKLSNITGQQNLKAGVYLVKLQANGFTTIKKAIVF